MVKIRDWMPGILCGKIMPHNTVPAELQCYAIEGVAEIRNSDTSR